MFFNANSFDTFYICFGTSVQNWEFWTVNLNQAIVYASCIKCGHGMFYGTYFYPVFHQDCTAGCINYIFSYCINDGLII